MIRSILFKFFFFLGIILICIVFLPSFFLPKKITLYGGRIMGYWCKICLNIILSTKIIIKGKENIISGRKFFIACSHQSMFETFFLQTIFNSPVFILKKELLKIPIFGWYLNKIGSISIDRDKINKENLNFKDQITNVVKSTNRPIIIFPQATRSEPLDRAPFKKGAARIYEDLNIICQPVAINSGNVWPKYGSLKSNNKIVVSILRPIEPGKDKTDFLKSLENSIYSELDKLN